MGGFNMIFTSFICFFPICYLVQAMGRNDSTCPKLFSCGNLTDLSWPLSLSTQPNCGIIQISGCDDAKPFRIIQLVPGGDLYYTLGNLSDYKGYLREPKLRTELKQHKCQAFDQNISIPDSPFMSFKISTIHNFFKCNSTSSSTPNITQKMKDHFAGYKMYNGCKGFSIYYKLPLEDVRAGNLPANCSLIRLPIGSRSDDGGLFNMLSSRFQVQWELSEDCDRCDRGGGQCQTDKTNKFHCIYPNEPHDQGHQENNLHDQDAKMTRSKLGLALGAGIGLFTVGLLILLVFFRKKISWYKCLRFWESNAEDHQNIEAFLKNYGSYGPRRYNYSEVKRMTSHFKNKLGQGGYGSVYKGSLQNGKHVAVKVLNELKGSGEEFINEVASIRRTSHVNVVSLVGFCFKGRKRALIYEFMPNGSLEKFIYEERSDRVRQLDWPILYQIALGIARGLEYLHRGCNTRILHFDIKPHNILLDEDFCPKISDFGLAKLCIKKESVVSMLGPRGTIGYIAPEIVCRNLGGVSHKSDVYSYGMMVLEMVGGRKNVDVGVDRTSEIYFPHWLYRRIELDEELQLSGIMNEEEKECARKMVLVSLWCIQTDPSNRPSMSKVLEMLEGKLDFLQIPPKPYLYFSSRTEAMGRNDSTCPKLFSCGNLTDLSFPYSLSTQPDCGLMHISGCDAKPFPRIQLLPGGNLYDDTEHPFNNTVFLRDPKLHIQFKQHKCQAFDQNVSFPNSNSPSISFQVMLSVDMANFIKCNSTSSSTPNITQNMKDHFAGYKMYTGCKGFSIYYKLPPQDVRAGDFPANCSLIRLPIGSASDDGGLFNMLRAVFLVQWKLSDDCNKCHYGGGQCQTDKTNKFHCTYPNEPHDQGHQEYNLHDQDAKMTRSKLRLALGAGTGLLTVGLLILLCFFRKKILRYKFLRFWESNAEDHQNIEAFLKNYGSYAPKRYNYSEVKRMTSCFKYKLGQGGYGSVYKGSLQNGSHVAVKVLNGLKGSGEEFINEVSSISRTSHVNVVSLEGFCFEGRKRALIYEFMPNGSLEKFIYEERSHSFRQLGWPILYKIALGIARGLEYLHRGCNTRILHFDIKPHNILLDEDFCPKISDFGLAKLCMKKESIVSMLGARGTIGYIAPEIVCRNLGGVSHKSDVYSYGMMVLEMVGGRKNVDVGVDRTSEIYFPHWLYQRIELDEELQLAGIMNEEENECARKMVMVSLWCIQTDPSNRPSMSKVVEMLEGKVDYLQMPPKPYLYSPSRTEVGSTVVELV